MMLVYLLLNPNIFPFVPPLIYCAVMNILEQLFHQGNFSEGRLPNQGINNIIALIKIFFGITLSL